MPSDVVFSLVTCFKEHCYYCIFLKFSLTTYRLKKKTPNNPNPNPPPPPHTHLTRVAPGDWKSQLIQDNVIVIDILYYTAHTGIPRVSGAVVYINVCVGRSEADYACMCMSGERRSNRNYYAHLT